ncbi:hypothetical protein FOL47_000875, partial [Perkinsus chesapeaki]
MGLGNRQYVHFNHFAVTVDAKLSELGATRIYHLGQGDDDGDIEEDFAKWKDEGLLDAVLAEMMGVRERSASAASTEKKEVPDVRNKLNLVANFDSVKTNLPYDATVHGGGMDVISKFYFTADQATVQDVRELRQKPDLEEGLTTVHLDVDISTLPGARYRTADNLEILPRNPEAEVLAIAERFGCEDKLDMYVGFTRSLACTKTVVKKPFPTPCTLRDALALYCDLNGHPTKAFVRDMCSTEAGALDPDELMQLWKGKLVTIAEVTCDTFKASPVSIGEFLQIVPRQKCRAYTISSSNLETPRTISATVGLIHHPRADQKPFRGVATENLCTVVKPGDKMWVQVRASSFRLPANPTAPIIMISAGTGVAPMRAFMREFTIKPRPAAKKIMLFGCRYSDRDWVYADEMKEFAEKSGCKLFTAFSREQENKIYVQDLVTTTAKADLQEALEIDAYVYICGSQSMGRSVIEALRTIGADVDKMRGDKRIVEELCPEGDRRECLLPGKCDNIFTVICKSMNHGVIDRAASDEYWEEEKDANTCITRQNGYSLDDDARDRAGYTNNNNKRERVILGDLQLSKIAGDVYVEGGSIAIQKIYMPRSAVLRSTKVTAVASAGWCSLILGFIFKERCEYAASAILLAKTPAVAGMKLEVVSAKPKDTEPANLLDEVKEPGMIADFVIEQCEDWMVGNEEECLAVQYDLSGNAKKYSEALREKLGMKRIGQLMGDKAFIHVDDKDLTDMDALIIAKMLRFHNTDCEMLDINNNPRMGDSGVGAIAEH